MTTRLAAFLFFCISTVALAEAPALSGTFSVDPDGAPHDVTLTLAFGDFAMRRTS